MSVSPYGDKLAPLEMYEFCEGNLVVLARGYFVQQWLNRTSARAKLREKLHQLGHE